MMTSFTLSWNNHLANLRSLLKYFYHENILTDVTISCKDGLLKAHKLILSLCSPYFEEIFKESPAEHPIIILKSVTTCDIDMLLRFMYFGSIKVPEVDLKRLLDLGDEFQIKGLTNSLNQNFDHCDSAASVSEEPPLDNLNYNNVIEPESNISQPSEFQYNMPQEIFSQSQLDNSQPVTTTVTTSANMEESDSGMEVYSYVSNLNKRIKSEVPDEDVQHTNIIENCYNPIEQESTGNMNESLKHFIDNSEENDNQFICQTCKNTFKNKVALQRHQETHTGKKPHVCEVCFAKFLRQSHLQRHMRTHTGEKPYKCTECGKMFARSDKLKNHYAYSHDERRAIKTPRPRGRPRKNYDPYQTAANDQNIPDLNAMYTTHTGKKPHVCEVCSASFLRLSHLQRHIRTHTGEKPYTCTECGKMFARSDKLKHHYAYSHNKRRAIKTPKPRGHPRKVKKTRQITMNLK